MKQTIKEIYFDWLDYYIECNTFCPHSDANLQCADYICEIKPNWSYERASQFVRNLITR